jgi:hypothetical protein
LRKTPIFRRKLAKIAENCDQNIDPWLSRAIFVVDVETARWRQKNECNFISESKLDELEL